MRRYTFSLGNSKGIDNNNIKRMLFSISFNEFKNQTNEILYLLKTKNIHHRDINPGNLLFSERDRKIKLVDFYWSKTDGIEVGIPENLNSDYFIDDIKSIETIQKQISVVNEKFENNIKDLKNIISKFGDIYYDGSSVNLGKSYHKIDIPSFKNILYHKNTEEEFNTILNNISIIPEKIIDIGSSVGYNSFGLLREFNPNIIFIYESDPHVFNFLKKVKKFFNLSELNINNKVDEKTRFESVDLSLCMNVHMWLHKQLKNKVDNILSNLFEKSKETFFQTSGLESSGMYKVESLKSKEDIKKYLESLTDKKVYFIRTTNKHGGLRHLFKVY